jgi:dihydropyrimidinase
MDNSCDLLIINASAVIPRFGILPETNILIEDGRIKALSKSAGNINAGKKINVNGKYVLPGLIDPHVHYGVYTPVEKAATTESRSASIGGVTTMVRMLRMNETYRNIEKHLEASKGRHYIDYAIHASILNSEHLNDIDYLRSIGINSFKLYMNLGSDLNSISMDLDPGSTDIRNGRVSIDKKLMVATIKKASNDSSIVLIHAEDPDICSKKIKTEKENEKRRTTKKKPLRIWSDSRPPKSEAQSIYSTAQYARQFDCDIYYVHVGSRLAVDTIIKEREKSASSIYIETCPHYLTHTIDYDSITGKVVPPIRTKDDLERTWSALENGIIDTIGSDHVANKLSIKRGEGDIWSALSGFPGISTMLPVLLSKGVNEGRINIQRVSEVTSYNAACIFGMYPKKGTIQVGSDADLTIVDLELKKKVSPDMLQSFSDYTIYDGWNLQGWPVMTMVRGEVVMDYGQVIESTLGHGEFVTRPSSIAM